jgi:peptidoglycan/LPS O-acetylase OafA/YrhL
VSTVVRPHCFLGRMLELPIFRLIGHLSYSIYVWQSFFLVNYGANRPLQPLQSAAFGLRAALLVHRPDSYL